MARTKSGSKIISFRSTRFIVFSQLWKSVTTSSFVRIGLHLCLSLVFIAFYNFRVLSETKFPLHDGQNSMRSRPIIEICSFNYAATECYLRRISGNYPSRIWGHFTLRSCRASNYLSVDIKITSIGVPSEKLWPFKVQCCKSQKLAVNSNMRDFIYLFTSFLSHSNTNS